MFLLLAVLEMVFPSNREWAVHGRLRGHTLVHGAPLRLAPHAEITSEPSPKLNTPPPIFLGKKRISVG